MIKAIRLLVFFALLSILLTGQAKDSEYSFRGILLGDSLTKSALVLPQAFKAFKVDEEFLNTFGILRVRAGNEDGFKECNVIGDKECLTGNLVFTQKSVGQKLYLMEVEQTFPKPVTFNAIKESMQAAYGAPSYISAPKESSQYASTPYSITSFVWGGNKVPMGEFEAKIPEDYDRIGGKFITAKVFRVRGLVTGYKLILADTDLLIANKPAFDKDFDAMMKERQDSRNKVIRF